MISDKVVTRGCGTPGTWGTNGFATASERRHDDARLDEKVERGRARTNGKARSCQPGGINFTTVSINCAGRKGFTIHALTPTARPRSMRSLLPSVVQMMMGVKR